MSTWGLIIAALYVVVHVLSALMKEIAKKKEREKQMEEAERRRIAQARLEPPALPDHARAPELFQVPQPVRPGPASPSTIAPTPVPIRTGRPIDDLAARRKAQLEKLRMGKPTPSRPTSPPPDLFRRPASQPTPPPVRTLEEQARINREHQRAIAKTKGQQRQREVAAAAQRRRLATVEPEVAAPVSTLATARAAPSKPAEPVRAHVHSDSIRERLRNRQSLRELIVLKEVIDPPLALR